MNKYNCNNTLEYVHEFNRMCKTFDCCDDCSLCDLPCARFAITTEHIRLVQEWSDAHPENVLTDKQREILGALNLLGLRYIARDSDGAVYAYSKRPRKWYGTWVEGGEHFDVMNSSEDVYATVFPLVEWSDTEPLCIAEALEQAEEANP